MLSSAFSDEKEISIDGRLSASRVAALQPELKDALDKRLKWTVIKADAVRRWPIITKLAQQARQVAGQLHNGETHFEMLRTIQRTADNLADPNTGAIDWNAVQKAVSVYSKPTPSAHPTASTTA